MSRFAGRVAMITGAGQGIGAVRDVVAARDLVGRLAREYRDAHAALGGA